MADSEVSRPCVCEGSCPCCRVGEIVDHCCTHCVTVFCPTCHGIAKAIWARAYDNVSKCRCQEEANPIEHKYAPGFKPDTSKREDISIYLDIEGTQVAAFRDPNNVRHFLKRLARRQEDVISAIREMNKRLSRVEGRLGAFNEQLKRLEGIYEIEEGEDITEVENTDG